MSALLNALDETLSATISSGPTEAQHRLIAAWIRIPTAEAQGSVNTIFDFSDSANAILQRLGYDNGRNIEGASMHVSSFGKFTATGGAFPVDTWVLVGMLQGPNTGATAVRRMYYGGTAESGSSVANSSPGSRVVNRVFIGRASDDNTQRVRGYVAEVAVFAPDDVTEADAIMTSLETYVADANPVKAPIWYRPLLGDANTGGSGSGDLTVNGTTTFDAGVHPTLSSPDTTAPILTTPTATATGQTTASGSVTTDEGNGTLYYLASGNSSESAATVKGGSSQAVSGTGVQNVTFTGLTANTPYYPHYVHDDAADNESNVASGSQFTTDAIPDPGTKGVLIQLSAGAESLSGLSVRWWDDPTASGAPDYEADNETTDSSGWLEIDLDSVTALDIDDPGYLLVFKAGATSADDNVAAGRVAIVDISA